MLNLNPQKTKTFSKCPACSGVNVHIDGRTEDEVGFVTFTWSCNDCLETWSDDLEPRTPDNIVEHLRQKRANKLAN